MNCHYVTKWITEHWEDKPGKLWYFDFNEQKVKRGLSKRLFAELDTNTDATEKLLNRILEIPLKQLLAQIKSGNTVKPATWVQYRAAYLYYLIQSVRYQKAKSGKKSHEQDDLDKILNLGEDHLNEIAKEDMKLHKIVVVNMAANQPLFFTELGYFPFAFVDPGCITNYTYGLVFPITTNTAFIRVSKSVDDAYISSIRSHIGGQSIGTGPNASRVLIPKELRKIKSNDEIAQFFNGLRSGTNTFNKGVQAHRNNVASWYESKGFMVSYEPLASVPIKATKSKP